VVPAHRPPFKVFAPAKTAAPAGAGLSTGHSTGRKRSAERRDVRPGYARPLVVTFLSQTGRSREAASQIHEEAKSRGYASELLPFDKVDLRSFEAARIAPVLVVVASSTGQGVPPNHAVLNYSRLRDMANGRTRSSEMGDARQYRQLLQGVHFATLGLGSRNYVNFMKVPRDLSLWLTRVGATQFHRQGEADDAGGARRHIDKWMDDLWPELVKVAALDSPVPRSSDGGAPPAPVGSGDLGDGSEVEGSGRTEDVPLGDLESAGWVCPPGAEMGAVMGVPEPLLRVTPAPPGTRSGSHESTLGTGSGHWEDPTVRRWEADAEGPFSVTVSFSGAHGDQAQGGKCVLLAELVAARGELPAFVPGDTFSILPCNCPLEVRLLLQRLGASAEDVLEVAPATGAWADMQEPPIPSPLLAGDLLERHLDVCGDVDKSLLRMLADHTTDEAEQRTMLFLCSASGRSAFTTQIEEGRATLLDLLIRWPSCRPPLGAVASQVRRLRPRKYSIASSPLRSPHSLSWACTVVEYPTKYRSRDLAGVLSLKAMSGGLASSSLRQVLAQRRGVCTSWLHRQFRGSERANTSSSLDIQREVSRRSKAQIWVHTKSAAKTGMWSASDAFRVPRDLSRPWIMVGPGTGVAPFRGFLQHRQAMLDGPGGGGKPGQAWLFFGCRDPGLFLYEDELRGYEGDPLLLSRLEVAFSRVAAPGAGEGGEGPRLVRARTLHGGEYVQHRIEENAATLRHLIVECGALVFVCGDAGSMTDGVEEALGDVLGGGEELAKLVREGRYITEVWA